MMPVNYVPTLVIVVIVSTMSCYALPDVDEESDDTDSFNSTVPAVMLIIIRCIN